MTQPVNSLSEIPGASHYEREMQRVSYESAAEQGDHLWGLHHDDVSSDDARIQDLHYEGEYPSLKETSLETMDGL